MNMKRILSLLLALVLTLALSLPALAAEEDTGFTDIQPDDWCAPYVKVCADHGLMRGLGDGRFAPERTLTYVECAVLAMRLADILQGGGGNLPAAPEDWAPDFFTTLSVEPGAWYRDAWYYASHNDLVHCLPVRDKIITQYEFASVLSDACYTGTCNEGLARINQIETLPDTNDSAALTLYNWGIVNGKNQYGSFCGKSTLTRAECAAMLARVLDPSLRLELDPFPVPDIFPTEGYTLTYLMDGTPDCGISFPVCLFGEGGIMLTLDGKKHPWPVKGAVPSYGLGVSGNYCYMGDYDESTPDDRYDIKAGLIDRTGKFIVPPKNGRTTVTYAVEGGFFSVVVDVNGNKIWELMDEQGRFVRELEKLCEDCYAAYPPKERTPLRGIEAHGDSEGVYFVDNTGLPVSRHFDWAGYISDDGQGFVGIDGKTYRIEFAK